jgi:hypothetical protein
MRPDATRRAILAGAAPLLAAACTPPAVDYCRLGESNSLLFIDVTTPYDDTDRREIKRIFASVVETLSVGDRLTVRTISEKYADSILVFDQCKPGCPPGEGVAAQYLGTRCSQTQMQADLDGYLGALIRDMQPLIQNESESRYSDVLATLGRLTHSFAEGRRYDEIVLYSDMLENSPDRPWIWFRDQSADDLLRAAEAAMLLPRAEDAVVRIFGFGRLHSEGRPLLPTMVDNKLRAFWSDYFLAGGAAKVLFGVPPGD